jgi:uncharacterized delta-60 repeat protein
MLRARVVKHETGRAFDASPTAPDRASDRQPPRRLRGQGVGNFASVVGSACLVAALLLPSAALAAPGDLDPSFGLGGLVLSDFGGGYRSGDLALHSDGKIIVVGEQDADWAVTRFNENGSLDVSFSGDGKWTRAADSDDTASAVAVQPDGKIVVAGLVDLDFGLTRLNPDGTPDVTFAGGGVAASDFDVEDYPWDLAIQPDGKIVVVGLARDPGGRDDLAIARFNADGSADSSFSGDGKARLDFGTDSDAGYGVALQPDGKIVVAGTRGGQALAVVRFASDGSLDPSFSGDGEQFFDFGGQAGVGSAYGVVIQPSGKIVVAGEVGIEDLDFALARFNGDGSPDPSFAGGGAKATSFGEAATAYDLAQQPDGALIAAGRAYDSGDFALARYTADGQLDTSFLRRRQGESWPTANGFLAALRSRSASCCTPTTTTASRASSSMKSKPGSNASAKQPKRSSSASASTTPRSRKR